MKQALLRKGRVTVEEVPFPARDPGRLLIELTRSLISTGTDMGLVQNSEESLLQKIRKKPDAIKKGLESIRVRGLLKTLSYANDQLDESRALGYSCAGRVLAVGDAVQGFQAGERVACAGAGLANHAEVVSVPANLCVRIPEGVSDRAASFVTLGAIALQGVRRADVRLGEIVCVVGLGLIGQLTVQLLVAAGCRVIGIDLDRTRVDLATRHGMSSGATSTEELERTVRLATGQQGVDVTILTASTSSSDPVQLAFQLTRKKGKIVVVGAVGMDLKRSPFYEKEQDFLISCSYGPGRYDDTYEKDGHDYPYAYVRWTENRNMVAFLDLIQQQRIDVEALIDEEVKLEAVTDAYESLAGRAGTKPLAIVIAYPEVKSQVPQAVAVVAKPAVPVSSGIVRLGLIGAGSFAKAMHLPNVEKLKPRLKLVGVCTGTGATALTMGRQLNVSLVTNDYREMLNSSEVDAVLVSTRHNNHAEITEAALKAGKHIYLEKPLALTMEELEGLDRTVRELGRSPVMMVGFNRRYSPFALKLERQFSGRTTPLLLNYRVNAGMLPENHWTLGREGGGRLRGEACHMVDLFRFLVGNPLKHYDIDCLPAVSAVRPDENFVARFAYTDGSICTLTYTAIGHKSVAKEWMEGHWDSRSVVLDDYKTLNACGSRDSQQLPVQDKGHAKALETFVEAVLAGTAFPIPWEQLYETTRATIELDREAWGRPSN